MDKKRLFIGKRLSSDHGIVMCFITIKDCNLANELGNHPQSFKNKFKKEECYRYDFLAICNRYEYDHYETISVYNGRKEPKYDMGFKVGVKSEEDAMMLKMKYDIQIISSWNSDDKFDVFINSDSIDFQEQMCKHIEN